MRLVADDESETVTLLTDELRLVEQTIRAERGLVDTSWGEGPDTAEISAETDDHTGAGNAGVVSEPDSPPAVVGALDDVDAVVEAPPEPKGAGRPTRVTNERLIAWLQVNPNSSVPDICRHFGYSSNGSMYARLQKMRGDLVTQDPKTKRWSALTAPVGEPVAPPPTAPVKKAPATAPPRIPNPDFRGPPVPPRPTHSNPADGLGAQLVEIVETHGPMSATEAFSALPTSARARVTVNEVSVELERLFVTGEIARPRRGQFEAAP